MPISVLYNIALLLLVILGAPWWLYLFLTSARHREGLGQRFFGMSAAFAARLPAGPRIWVHAVSVGEVLAISGLVQELAQRLPGHSVVVSTTTRTGQQLARDRFGVDRCFYFPFDFPWAVAATLRRMKPAILILAESELWPNVLTACTQRRVPVMIVNARVSDRSLPRYMKLRAVWGPFLEMLSLVLAQTAEDADRLRRIGIPDKRIRIGGNLKFDIRAPQNVAIEQLLRRHLAADTKLLVCGSTLEGEEAMLLAAWPGILAQVPDAVMLLAPRHPERFGLVAGLLARSPHAWMQRSLWSERPGPILPGSIFLLDSIGELAALYALARVAFVGGSLVPAGGHNPLEPAQFGVAIAMGPHSENFRAIVDLLLASHAITIFNEERLAPDIAALLLDEPGSMELGRNAQSVCAQQAGATARCADAIVELLRGRA